jgi:tRNA nucleotidyltransferase (CCA-adding enzyme)
MQEASLEDLKRLAEIRRCDGTAHADHPIMTIVRGNTQTFTQLLTDPTLESAPITPSQLAVSGTDLMALGVPQGKELGQALNWLLEQVMDERCPNEHDALLTHWVQHTKEESQ